MARIFLQNEKLGWPFRVIREASFVLLPGSRRRLVSPCAKILFVLEGNCRLVLDDSGIDRELQPGDIFIAPFPTGHSYVSDSPDREERLYTFGIYLQKSALWNRKSRGALDREVHRLLRKLLVAPRLLESGQDREIRQLLHDLREELEFPKFESTLRLHALSLSLLILVARALDGNAGKERPAPRTALYVLNEVQEFIAKSIHVDLTLEDIAHHVNLSAEHLARVFRRERGETVMDYVRGRKVDEAKTHLMNSNLSIQSVAGRVGFEDTRRFSRIFRKFTGDTPLEYRRRHAGSRS